MGVPWTGQRYTDLMERYPHLATFGFMIQDTSRGEVRAGPGGAPLLLYNLNEADIAPDAARRSTILCEVYQAAGARRVLPLVPGHEEVNTQADLARLRDADLRAGDFEVTAFHPLGTCRIGEDEALVPLPRPPGPRHRGLYVCDGSAVPSSLGVNPQMTIMAMALRAAEIVDSRLS